MFKELSARACCLFFHNKIKFQRIRRMESDAKVSESNFVETPIKLGGIEIKNPLGLGTWAWGDSSSWGYNSYDKSFNKETLEVF
jgi:hypothetical protein